MNVLAIDLDQTLLHTDKTVSAYTQAIFHRLKTETDSIIKHGAKALEELDEREYCHYGRERTR